MLTIIKLSVRLTQSDNVRARFNSNNRHSLRYYCLFFDKFFTQYPDKEKRSSENRILVFQTTFCRESESLRSYSGLNLNQYCVALPYYLYCLRLRRLVLIFVNPLYLPAYCRLRCFSLACCLRVAHMPTVLLPFISMAGSPLMV